MLPPVSYSDSLRWLYARNQFAVKLGLENPRRLLEKLGGPERGGAFLHVAGTNGKGSVCANLAAMLEALGISRVGAYTSPHLVSFRERIRINGAPVPTEAVTAWMRRAWPALESLNPTYFECVTALALSWFRERECGAAVLETGLGGRLDATNTVLPRVTVITTVSLDHTEVLGNTLEAILREKLGIVKPGVPLVIDEARPELARVAEGAAREADAEYVNLEGRLRPGAGGWRLRGRFREYGLPADLRSADWQMRNAALSVLALESFHGIALPPENVWMPALREARMPGRMQWLHAPGRIPVLLDGAHNPAGMAALCGHLARIRPGIPARVFFSVMHDKNYAEMYGRLRGISRDIVFIDLTHAFPRALPEADLRAGLEPADRAILRTVPLEREAIDTLLRTDTGAGYAVFCGSLYLLGEAIPLLAGRYGGLEELVRLQREDDGTVDGRR